MNFIQKRIDMSDNHGQIHWAAKLTLILTLLTAFTLLLNSPAVEAQTAASVLAISSAPQTIFEGDVSGPITIETRDAGGNPAPSASDVIVTLSSSSATGVFDTTAGGAFDGTVTSVTVPAGQTSATVFYRDNLVGTATITATAASFPAATQTATQDITVNSAVTNVTVSGSPVKAGGTVIVTAIGQLGATATFSIGTIVTDKAMLESITAPGTYTGDFTPVISLHPDGTYDVTATIGASSLTVTGGFVIDNTAPTLTGPTANPTTIANGQTLTLTVTGESGVQVSADVSTLDTTQTNPVALVESPTAGTYSASVVISASNTAVNGVKTITITATDAAGNVSTAVTVAADLQSLEFNLSVPMDIGLVYIPLRVTTVNNLPMPINTIGDFFDALGGPTNVSLIITRDTSTGVWRSFLGDLSRGTLADATITDYMGIITVMTNPVTLNLKGQSIGITGITLEPGTNLIGLPPDPSLTIVSDLFGVGEIATEATAIIVSDGGTFKAVAQVGDDGDIALTGGQSFISNRTKLFQYSD